MDVPEALPGADLIRTGLTDIARGVESIEALLVQIGAPRLRRIGFDVADTADFPEDRLYARLAAQDSDAAHARYNALIRLLVSFERAAECANRKTNRGHRKDRVDVEAMIRDGLVDPAKLQQLFRDIEPELDRHPAVDPTTLRRVVEQLAQ